MMKHLINILVVFFLIQGGFEAMAQRPVPAVNQQLLQKSTNTDPKISPASLEKFLAKERLSATDAAALKKFYADRDFRFAWLTKDGLGEHVQSFWKRYEGYMSYTRDSSFYNLKLHETIKVLASQDNYKSTPADTIIELSLTHHFYTFIQRVYSGKIDPINFQWHIPRKKVAVLSLLGDFLLNPNDDLDWLPVSQQYLKMREKLVELQTRQQQEKQESLFLADQKLIRPGDTSSMIIAIKRRLLLTGDMVVEDNSPAYTENAVAAVLNFQRRHGLAGDGIIGPQVIKSLNIPLNKRIEQLMINMERVRWVPAQKPGTSVWVNIPDYKLYVLENNVEVLSMGIIVGQAANRTVIFSDEVQYVVFSPYWNVPESIVKNEIVPAMSRNQSYLADHQMEIVNTRNGLPVVRQKPGSRNALGRVKFIFPNVYNIYLHDTPQKSFFERSDRALSHGCIRLSKPMELAKYFLKNDPSWTDDKIRSAMATDQEKWVKLSKSVPIYIGYFTAWVDVEGQLHFREDIYGHDKRVADQLFN